MKTVPSSQFWHFSWWREKGGRSVRVAGATFHIFNRISASQLAAAFSYYAFFSIFPFIALLIWVGSLIFPPIEVARTIHEMFPLGGEASQLVWEGVRSLQRAHGTLNAFFVLVFLWGSLKFFQALVHGVNLAWCEEHLPWWQLPLKNLLMVLTVISALLLGVIAPFLIQIARNLAAATQDFLHLHFPHLNVPVLLPWVDWARLILASVVLFYAISILYMLAPRVRVRFVEVWPAALAVSIFVQMLQVFFANYLPLFIRYNAIYGAVGGVMFLLLWIYVTGVVVLAGACWCAAGAGECRLEKAEGAS